MRLSELDFQNSILILENIKQKLREVKQDRSALPEGEYKEFKADMFDGLELPFTVNLLINGREDAPSVSSNTVNNETKAFDQLKSPKNQSTQKEKLEKDSAL
ncbi:hypothetical protein LOAG_07838 [Loa loa]|uniref:ATP-binding protein n=1 Tax=Loa loa TaxID=7209 RepID=A0A1I7VZT6_LOALO|nr:hypothetical protein LOAG_07838 [Loa loa]EFO20651.1 hypothetical protein LOAG_07838 [Loa loa]